MNYIEIYNKIFTDLDKIEGNEEKFTNLFLLTCLLVYNLSSRGKNLDKVLEMLTEFDYKRNFEGNESQESVK